MNPRAAPTRLLLVGAGHAHLEVLRRLLLAPRPDLDLTLVSAHPRHHYSGMVPGYLAGTYREEEITFDLAPLARRAGGVLIVERAVAVDPRRRAVELADGRRLPYDLASFNVGSRAAGRDAPGVERHAALVKPMFRVAELDRRLAELARRTREDDGVAHAAVVGGGAAGVEIACALDARLEAAGVRRRITLLEASPQLLREYPPRLRRLARGVLARRAIAVRTGVRAAAVAAAHVELEGGAALPSRLTVWLTGAAAPELFRSSGLALDERGFLLVDPILRSLTDPRLFAAGDCATLAEHPGTPKAGVYAVRQAPVLWANLEAALEGRDPRRRYHPQASFLSLLNTADGKALLRYKFLATHARWAWWLKDRIDRRFTARYQRLARSGEA